MVDRIRALLLARQLSPTQFADTIGVARPIVSHIMSGRNKPSLEVVQKILGAFPDLSMPWLLNGSGPMLGPVKTTAAAEIPLLETSSPPPRRRPVPPALPLREADAEVPRAESPAVAGSTVAAPPAAEPELALFAEPGKAIRRIVIFYRDGTFADYQPE